MTNPEAGVQEAAISATEAPQEEFNSSADAAEAIVSKGILDGEEDYEPSQDRGHTDRQEASQETQETQEEEQSDDEDIGEGTEMPDSSDEDDEYDEVPVEVPSYTVQVNGKSETVDLEELKSGYQKGADYTRKTQALSEDRKSFDAERNAIGQERVKYQQALTQFQTMMSEQYDQYRDIDWNTLKEEDPIGYMTRKEEMRDIESRGQRALQEQQAIQQQQNAEYQRSHQELVQREMDLLGDKMPEWKTPEKRAKINEALKLYAGNIGYTPEELDAVTDHRALIVLDKARKYDRIQASNPKKVRNVPKVAKGRGKSESPSRDKSTGRFKSKMNAARKAGGFSSTEETASAIFDML